MAHNHAHNRLGTRGMLLHSAAFRMSSVVMPALAAAVAAAPLVECALNTPMSMPAFSIIDLSHLGHRRWCHRVAWFDCSQKQLGLTSISLRRLVLLHTPRVLPLGTGAVSVEKQKKNNSDLG